MKLCQQSSRRYIKWEVEKAVSRMFSSSWVVILSCNSFSRAVVCGSSSSFEMDGLKFPAYVCIVELQLYLVCLLYPV